MKNNNKKPDKNELPNLMRLPENKAPRIWVKVFRIASRIPRVYWLLALAVALVAFVVSLPSNARITFWFGLKNHLTLVNMLLVFSLLAISLVWTTGQRIDVWILMLFNMHGYRPLWLDWVMLAFTQLGNFFFTMFLAIILYINTNNMLAYELIIGTIFLWMVVELMKMLIRRKRPYIKLKKIRIVGVQASGRSFPSGHTSQAFFMATLLFHNLYTSIFIGLLLYAIACIVGITRMYVGMHYPRDVMAGAILGIVWGTILVLI